MRDVLMLVIGGAAAVELIRLLAGKTVIPDRIKVEDNILAAGIVAGVLLYATRR